MSDTPATGPEGTGGTAHDTPGRAGGPTLSLGEAVRVTGAARSTLQRRLHAGAIAGAERTAEGGWSVPVAGLIAAGFLPKVSPPDPAEEPVPDPFPERGTSSRETELSAEVVRLRAELEAARVLAEERALHLADLRAALEAMSRALPPAPSSTTSPSAEGVRPPRRRWWRSS